VVLILRADEAPKIAQILFETTGRVNSVDVANEDEHLSVNVGELESSPQLPLVRGAEKATPAVGWAIHWNRYQLHTYNQIFRKANSVGRRQASLAVDHFSGGDSHWVELALCAQREIHGLRRDIAHETHRGHCRRHGAKRHGGRRTDGRAADEFSLRGTRATVPDEIAAYAVVKRAFTKVWRRNGI
jgi:hypothetical protein